MNGLDYTDERSSEVGKKALSPIMWTFLAAIAFVIAAILYVVGKKLGLRLAFDADDMGVYFKSARWVIEGGRLYREVPSEYPLLANITFAVLRYLGLDSQLDPVECPDKGSGGKEVSGEFVVTGGDASPVFDAAEVVLDFVASSIEALGAISFLDGIAAARDDR